MAGAATRTTIEIVSPERLLLTRDVDMAVIPGSEGEIGVLPNHAPMIVMLRGGTIRLYEGGQVVDRLFVAGGFAEITPERCTVLANEALPVKDLAAADTQARLRDAEAAYNAADKLDMAAVDASLDQLQIARSRVDAVKA